MTNTEVYNVVKAFLWGWVDFILGWLKWTTGAAIAVALFVMVAEQYGFRVPFLVVSNNVTTWAYLAGVYWLSR